MDKIEKTDIAGIEEGIKVYCEAMQFDLKFASMKLKGLIPIYENHEFHGFLSKENDEVTGFAAIIPIEKTAWVPYVGVHPTHHGQGIGTQLMTTILNFAESKDWKAIELVATSAALPLYHKVGFSDDYKTYYYKIISEKQKVELNSQAKEWKGDFPDWISKMDIEVMGYNRLNLLQLKKNPESTLITFDQEGYAILGGTHLGPVIANNFDVALDLIMTGVNLGAKSLILASNSKIKNKIHDYLELGTWPGMEYFTHMTYGTVSSDLDRLWCFRSVEVG